MTGNDELALVRNPNSGKMTLTWTGGDIAFDNSHTETIFSLLLEEDSWASNRKRGPSLRSVTLDTPDAPSQLKARAEQRLQIAIDDRRLKSATVTVTRVRRGAFSIGVQYVTQANYRGMVSIPIGL